jgi:hypothetical protein
MSQDNKSLLGHVILCATMDSPELSSVVAEQLFSDYPWAANDGYVIRVGWTEPH